MYSIWCQFECLICARLNFFLWRSLPWTLSNNSISLPLPSIVGQIKLWLPLQALAQSNPLLCFYYLHLHIYVYILEEPSFSYFCLYIYIHLHIYVYILETVPQLQWKRERGEMKWWGSCEPIAKNRLRQWVVARGWLVANASLRFRVWKWEERWIRSNASWVCFPI